MDVRPLAQHNSFVVRRNRDVHPQRRARLIETWGSRQGKAAWGRPRIEGQVGDPRSQAVSDRGACPPIHAFPLGSLPVRRCRFDSPLDRQSDTWKRQPRLPSASLQSAGTTRRRDVVGIKLRAIRARRGDQSTQCRGRYRAIRCPHSAMHLHRDIKRSMNVRKRRWMV